MSTFAPFGVPGHLSNLSKTPSLSLSLSTSTGATGFATGAGVTTGAAFVLYPNGTARPNVYNIVLSPWLKLIKCLTSNLSAKLSINWYFIPKP